MRLMAPAEFIETYFAPKSRPSVATVQRWITNDQIPGARRMGGKLLFVDADEFEAGGNEIVRRVLRDVSRAKTGS